MKAETIAFLGAGNMAEALIRGLLTAKLFRPDQIIAHDIRPERLEELRRTFGIRTGQPVGDVIVGAVKPQQMSAALSALDMRRAPLFVSIAAGIPTSRIEREIGGTPRVVRVMPNTPALVGAGATALCKGAYATDADLATAEEILHAVGITVRVDEAFMDAVTALSGSGPAYIFYVAEALVAAGLKAGLPPAIARQLTFQTIMGAGRMLVESADSPETLRQKVTSPGGTTAAALQVLSDRGLKEILDEAVQAATRRGRELSGT